MTHTLIAQGLMLRIGDMRASAAMLFIECSSSR